MTIRNRGMLALLRSTTFSCRALLNQRLPFTFNTHLNLNTPFFLPLMASTKLPAFSTGSPTPTKRVGTHNGSFHCDEALGCFMIRLTDNFSNAEIVRTRDPQVLLFSLSFSVWFPGKRREKKMGCSELGFWKMGS